MSRFDSLIIGEVARDTNVDYDGTTVQAIGGAEMLYYASTIGGRTFDYMPPLIGIAVMYLSVVIIFTWLQGRLERRLRESDRR